MFGTEPTYTSGWDHVAATIVRHKPTFVVMWVMSRMRFPMSRLTIDITDQQHQSLKALAALQGKTIKQYAIERLFSANGNDDEAWQELKALLGQRIADGLAGKVSKKSIAAIVDDEMAGEGRP